MSVHRRVTAIGVSSFLPRVQPLCRGRGGAELSWYGLTPAKQDVSAFHVPVPGSRLAGLFGNDYLQSFVVQLRFAPPATEISRLTGSPSTSPTGGSTCDRLSGRRSSGAGPG